MRPMHILRPVLVCLVILALSAGFAVSAEVDDSSLFVDAFNAFQKKDYLLTIDKITQLQQLFPDSPLRDVALLLQARAGLKAGDNQLAAKSVNQFNSEFSGNSLRSTIEDELMALGGRQLKGEQLQPNQQLRLAAQKVRSERLAQERAAAQKLELERQAREKAERDRVAREKAEAERKERERIAAEKAARDSIRVALSVNDSGTVLAAGENGLLPFEVANRSKGKEEFILQFEAPSEYAAQLAAAAQPMEQLNRISLMPGEVFKGVVNLRIPSDRVDGYRGSIKVRAVSARFNDLGQSRDALFIASAPLVRVVARPSKLKVVAGEKLRYRVSVLNIGSQAAQGLTIRVQLPEQLDFQGAPELQFRQEPNGTLVFRADRIETGGMTEFNLDVKVRETSRLGQELRGQVEVVNGQLQRKDIFSSAVAVVQAK